MTSSAAGKPETDAADRITLEAFALTDVGQTRQHNEDTFLMADLTTGDIVRDSVRRSGTLGALGWVFMVADGMGGGAAGELASELAVTVGIDEIFFRWTNVASRDTDTFVTALAASAHRANSRIHEYATEHPEYRGMGTTATIAGMLGEELFVVQIGDSRAYIVRDGAVDQITKDQSFTQQLIELGQITIEQAKTSEHRHIVLQALGPEPRVRIDLTQQKLRRGDTLVLCTDGLFGSVDEGEIAEAFRTKVDIEAACTDLIERANSNGGPDNITVVVVQIGGRGLRTSLPSDSVGYTAIDLPDSLVEESGAHDNAAVPVAPEWSNAGAQHRRLSNAVRVLLIMSIGIALVAAAYWVFRMFE